MVATVTSKLAARAKTAWMAILAEHRRPWPEWTELERRVRQRDFITQSIGPHVFLFSDAAGAEPPLSRQISSRGAAVPEAAPPFPGWIAALVGLACLGAGDLSSAGALAGDLWPPDKLRPSETLEGTAIFVLQRNRSGTPLFSDGTSVLGHAEETDTLETIAELEVFSRFCLRQSLMGEDWVAAWRRGDAEAEGIRPLAGF